MKKVLLIFGGFALMAVFGGLALFTAVEVVATCEDMVAEESANESERGGTAEQPSVRAEVMERCLYGDNPSAAPGGAGGSAIEPPADGRNGRLPDSVLETVSSHGSYECKITTHDGAASAWRRLIAAAQADGVDIEGGWCYRTYGEQEQAWRTRRCFVPGNCDGSPYPPTARPGHSNHGWGLAVDVWNAWDSILSCSDPEFRWLQANGPSFGWVHPNWARCGRRSQEPWHWEYAG